MANKVSIVIEKDDDGYFAYSPDLKGCMTQGDTYEEVMKNMREAVDGYLEDMTEEEKKSLSSKEILTASLEIDV
jgi:predicted RNase H-like HicB family nuclease